MFVLDSIKILAHPEVEDPRSDLRLVLGVGVPKLLEDGVFDQLCQLLDRLDDPVRHLSPALQRVGDQLAAAEADVVGCGLRSASQRKRC